MEFGIIVLTHKRDKIIMNKTIFSLSVILASIVMISFSSNFVLAETHSVDIVPIDNNVGIEKSIIGFYVSEQNSLPWGYVEGTITNHVPDYPVIIQIYDTDDDVEGNLVGGVHFAQTDVNEDGTYQYKFRVMDFDGDYKINIFSGNYTVKIFKVVYLDDKFSSI